MPGERPKAKLTPDAQYMGKVGLPRIIDKLLKNVLATQPPSPKSVLMKIRKACDEELSGSNKRGETPQTDDFLNGSIKEVDYLSGMEALSPEDRNTELSYLISKMQSSALSSTAGTANGTTVIDDSVQGAALYSHISEKLKEVFPDAALACLYLRDEDNEVLYDPEKPEHRAPVDSSAQLGSVVKTKVSVNASPTDAELSTLQPLLMCQCKSLIATPLINKDTVFGLVVAAGDNAFTAAQVASLDETAQGIGRVLVSSMTVESLDEATNQVEVLLDVARRLASELEVKSLIRTIMQVSRDLLSADRSTLFLVDKERNELWSSVADGTDEIRIPKTAGIAGAVATSGEPLNIPDAYADHRFNQQIDKKTGYKTNSMLCMPMANKQGEVIGVTQMINKKSGRAFGKKDERLLGAFSAQAAVAIENSLLFKSTEESKNLFMSVLASIKNLIVTLDKDGKMLTCNRDPVKFGIGISEATMRDEPYTAWFIKKTATSDVGKKTLEGRRSSSRGNIGKTLCDSYINGLLLESIVECYRTGKDAQVQDFTFITVDKETDEEKSLTINYTIMALKDFDGVQTGVVLSFEDISNEAQMMATLGKYMSPEIAAAALEGGTQLGGQQLPVSVLFVDIRNFTGLSEALSAAEVVETLNEYFQLMGGSVLDHGGIVDKYIGDAVMAVFGVPFPAEDDAHRVCSCALEMFELLDIWNARRDTEGLQPIRMGIGINTGEVVAGNIGFEKRMEYTVIGDGVNLSSRMEGATKAYKTHILITEFTYDLVHNDFHTREVDCIRVVGKKLPVKIFELQGRVKDGPLSDQKRLGNEQWAVGLEYYKKREWELALKHWNMAYNDHNDLTALSLIPRAQLFLDDPHIAPKDGWDGVWDMTSK